MTKILKILMLEDMEEDAGLIERELKKAKISYEALRVDTKEEFINSIQEFEPDVILSDHSLPQFNSQEALKICRGQGLEIPFILVTGAVSEEFAVSCLHQGADDYLLKGNLVRLPTAIENALKQKATEQERKLAVQNLMEQNMELTKINKELDRFVYSASHELRSPLLSFLGLVKLASNEINNEQYKFLSEYLQHMEAGIGKLDQTIKNIINYSKNSRVELTLQKINIHHLIEDVIDKLRYLQAVNKIKFNISITDPVPFYSCKDRMEMILSNIISNAIKYYNPKLENSFINLSVNVSLEKVIILIEDNGIGIRKDFLNNIFDMFFRATEKSDGSGLGLYIVKEALEKLNGTIEVDSVVGKGTTFKIEIPNSKSCEDVN